MFELTIYKENSYFTTIETRYYLMGCGQLDIWPLDMLYDFFTQKSTHTSQVDTGSGQVTDQFDTLVNLRHTVT